MKVVLGVAIGCFALAVAPCAWGQTAQELGFEAGADANGLPVGWPSSGVYLDGSVTVVEDAAVARSGNFCVQLSAPAGSTDGSQAYLIRQRGSLQGEDPVYPNGTEITMEAWYNVSGFDAPTTQVQPWIYQYNEAVALLVYSKGDDIRSESNDLGWIKVSHTLVVGQDASGADVGEAVATIGFRPAHAYFYEAANADGKDAVVLVDDVSITAGGPSAVEGDWALYE